MKPVNFIEINKDTKDIKKIVLLFLPLFLLVGFIGFDIFQNIYYDNKNYSDMVSLEEVNALEEDIQNLKIEREETDKKINFYKDLDIKKAMDKDLVKSLEVFSANTNNNIFINSFSSDDKEITITGVSLSSDLLDEFDQEIKNNLENFILNEVDFEDGYYKFSYKGEVKWNFLWT